MFWEEDHVVGTSKNICTVAVHCWYIKDIFTGFFQQVLERKYIYFNRYFSWSILSLEFKVYLGTFIPSPEI